MYIRNKFNKNFCYCHQYCFNKFSHASGNLNIISESCILIWYFDQTSCAVLADAHMNKSFEYPVNYRYTLLNIRTFVTRHIILVSV